MTSLVFDIEANGLEDVTKVWCYVSQEVDKDTLRCAIGDLPNREDLIEVLREDINNTDLLIGHNIKRYDLPVLESVLGVTYKGEIFDTLLMSRLLQQDRLGGHSLAAWAKRLGREKQEHDDWDNYSPEMLGRCRTDVEINVLIYHALLKEMEV